MARDPDTFLSIVEERELPPVVACGGVERVYTDDVVATVRRRALAGGLADFNHDRVSARDRSFSDIVALANTLPMMAARRLVEVRDAEALRDHDLPALEAYLRAPAKETVLLLLFGAIDLRAKAVKLIDQHALLCRFEHPRERDLPQHVARRARRHGLALDRAAVEALAATVGADLTLLERALEKLALVAEGGVVTAALVETHVADTHLEDAFALARAVAHGDRAAALRSLGSLQAAREEPLRLLGLLAWQLRQIVRTRALLDLGRGPQEVGRELSLYGDRLQAALGAARGGDAAAHAARLARLAGADRVLKGSRQPPWLVMHRLVLDLCPAAARGGGGAAHQRPPPR
ncbi:MAG: DNA polymerase III subunit delta [Deltaproteobacteria bacterium RBG_16_71_12]|nr:MAG: DNA polymerase III subunit delta [Deltaproteobacteria bacterium RBG_16_71_12]